jgi:hypothetical protein
MGGLLNMANAINKILLEAELKDLSNSFQVNDEIVLDTGALVLISIELAVYC